MAKRDGQIAKAEAEGPLGRPSRRLRLPPLNALRAFEAAARYRNFTLASDELCVTPGAVSRQIRVLEDYLAVRLFERAKGGALSLTTAGRYYWEGVSGLLSDLERVTDHVSSQREPGGLRIVTGRYFLRQWLLPRLGSFEEAHPGISIQLTIAMDGAAFDGEHDLGIRAGRGNWPNYSAIELFPIVDTPVCSPLYLQLHPPLTEPEDLSHHRLLRPASRKNEWASFLDSLGVEHSATTMDFEGDSLAAYDAAIAGMGVAIGRFGLIENDLRDGRLVTPLPVRLGRAESYFLLHESGQRLKPTAVQFADWLRKETAQAEGGCANL